MTTITAGVQVHTYTHTHTHKHTKRISGHDPQGAWRQEELIGGKPPVVK
jgi:hypothetical protein